jgi:hypothetical protein
MALAVLTATRFPAIKKAHISFVGVLIVESASYRDKGRPGVTEKERPKMLGLKTVFSMRKTSVLCLILFRHGFRFLSRREGTAS